MAVIEAKRIYHTYNGKDMILNGIDVTVDKGEFVSVLGASGSGKTTLLSILGGIERPSSGEVLVDGEDIAACGERRRAILRRTKIGFVFQFFNLAPYLTAEQNILVPVLLSGKGKREMKKDLDALLSFVGLADKRSSLPGKLSGGEQQRVAIARGLIFRPEIILLDEPTGNLDPAISLGIMKLLERINRTGTTVIVATHDREMVDSMHRRVIALEAGHVVRDQERGGYGNYGAL